MSSLALGEVAPSGNSMGFVGVFTGTMDNPFPASLFRDKTKMINFAEEYPDVVERLTKRRDQFEPDIAGE